MRGWLKRWRDSRTLARRAIPDPLWRLTLARFTFLSWRNEADVAQLRDMATLFLADKEFTGAQGLRVDDEMAVAIAAQACLPVLKLGLAWYDGLADGVPALPDRASHDAWIDVLTAEYDAFCERVDAEEDTDLDPYAAEAPEEFFAVASEAFFVAPRTFRTEHPRMYELLRGFFRQDPAAHAPR